MDPRYLASNQLLRKLAEQTAKLGQPREIPTLKTVRRGGFDPDETRAVLQQWQDDLQQFAELMAFLRSELSSTTRALAETRALADTLTENVSRLETERNGLQQELDYLRTAAKEWGAREQALKEDRDRAQADRDDLQSALADATTAADGWRRQAEALQEELETVRRGPDRPAEASEWEAAVEGLRERLQQMEAERAEIDRARTAERAEMERLRAQAETYPTQANPQLIQEAILSAQRFAAQLKEEAEVHVQQYMEAMQTEIQSRRETLDVLKGELTVLRQSMADEMNRQIADLSHVVQSFSDQTAQILSAHTENDVDMPALWDANVTRLEDLRPENRKGHKRSANL